VHGPLPPGAYSFIAIYSGDRNHQGSTSAVEPLTIKQGSTNTATAILDAITHQPPSGLLGESVLDTATVSGNAFTPTGTVTYEFFTNGSASGTPASTQTVTLNPDGTVPHSAIHGPLAAGAYSFIAVYSGDSNHQGSTSALEPLTIKQGSNGRLAGSVYIDSNNNGRRDPGEMGLPGVVVTLTGVDITGRPVLAHVVTNPAGYYVFLKMKAGTYALRETQPAGFLDGRATPGSAGGIAGNNVIVRIALGTNQIATGYLFGERGLLPGVASKGLLLASAPPAMTPPPGSGVAYVNPAADPSGYVYVDRNGNGRRDAGEPGIAGVLIVLTGRTSDGAVVRRETHTDATGFYQFADLRPGLYNLWERQPAGYRNGRESLGSLGGVAGNDSFTGIRLGPGSNGFNYNFGELETTPNADRPGPLALADLDEEPDGTCLVQAGAGVGPLAVLLLDAIFSSWGETPCRDADGGKRKTREADGPTWRGR
jgi:hypothetical protein